MNNKESKAHIWFAAIAIFAIILGSVYIWTLLKKTPTVAFTPVKQQDITQGVSVDGAVDAAQDLSLAFEQGGTVAEVDVQAGDAVKQGQTLVKLDTSDTAAAVSQASAALAAAQADYQKLLDGDTSADLNVSQTAVDSAQTALTNAQSSQAATVTQQNTIVQNAQTALLNSTLSAMASPSNLGSAVATITGTYTATTQGNYVVSIYNTGNGLEFQTSGLQTASGLVKTTPVALGTKGLFIQFSGTPNINDSWTINIPNTSATNYVANLNAYNAALQTQNQALTAAQSAVDSAQTALAQAQSALQLKQTPARPEDIDSAKAQVQSAQAQLQSAQDAYDKSVLVAPIDGIITSVDTKVGQTVAGSTLAPGPDAIEMISAQNFQIDAYVAESDIGKIKIGDSATATLDSYGTGTDFPATVILIDPAATLINGINSYKTTLQFNQNDSRIKSGMDANVVISDLTHQNALVVPASSVFSDGSQSFVLTQTTDGKPLKTPVQTGISGLDNNVEILSGLSLGQQVAAFGN